MYVCLYIYVYVCVRRCVLVCLRVCILLYYVGMVLNLSFAALAAYATIKLFYGFYIKV